MDNLVDLVSVTHRAVPWAIPLVALSMVLALVIGLVLQRSRGASAWLISALIVSLAFVAGLTLTPNRGGESTLVDPRLNKGPWGYLLSPEYWLHVDSRSLNVLLFIPLGIVLALFTRGRDRWIVLAIGLAAPWIVEGLQFVLPFNRDPQVIDLVDNSTGFLLGFIAGSAASVMLTALPRKNVGAIDPD